MRTVEQKREHKRIQKEEFEKSPCVKCPDKIISTRGGLSQTVGYYCPKTFEICDKHLRYRNNKIKNMENEIKIKEQNLEKEKELINKKEQDLEDFSKELEKKEKILNSKEDNAKIENEKLKKVLEFIKVSESELKKIEKKLKEKEKELKIEGSKIQEKYEEIKIIEEKINDEKDKKNNENIIAPRLGKLHIDVIGESLIIKGKKKSNLDDDIEN